MATSAIGPGFLTQTTVFTQQLTASFGFVILVSVLLDIGAQLNIWRVLTVTEYHAQDLANALAPGLGYMLAALVVLGGLAFNIGNIAGCGLGIQALSGMDTIYGALLSCGIALFIFWLKEAGKALDHFARWLGILMVLLTMYVAISSHPPVVSALQQSIWPAVIDTKTIVTLVGGTVGGYISFAGAHRLLDAGISGPGNIREVNKSAVSGIIITGIMRVLLFLAALGVVTQGAVLDSGNPPAAVFRFAAGEIGYRFFGMVMWSAAITSVVGAAYTSVSFLKTFHPFIAKQERWFISFVIVFSTAVFIVVGEPVRLLIMAGALNGLILPVALAVILIASSRKRLTGAYKHPLWMQVAGWLVVIIMSWLCAVTIRNWLI
ncbi:divalent metal cation transporter [Chitinophaga agrisoli]|uniref:Divalent metal cation transporter n=2 Tax=Chitinophaga agrisoli TaxID=2607653 RepID=A0A5B2VQF6_9BACT|nr:divalent metal cation transporter [Chitinophaga agrisoli]